MLPALQSGIIPLTPKLGQLRGLQRSFGYFLAATLWT
jgi:hypothetical protein